MFLYLVLLPPVPIPSLIMTAVHSILVSTRSSGMTT